MEFMPQIDLFPRVTKVAEAIKSLVRHLPESGYPSDHRGANAMLEDELGYNQQPFSFDSEGCYFDKVGE